MSRKEALSKKNYFQELLTLRDKQRKELAKSIFVVDGEDLPWETNEMGILRWYLHPSIKDTAGVRSLLFYMQRIPPKSRSGKLRIQGGQVVYFIEGNGYTTIDQEKYVWEGGDVLQIPLRWEGTVFQHFNTSRSKDALLIFCEPNFVYSLGVDRGCGFDILEPAPEFAGYPKP